MKKLIVFILFSLFISSSFSQNTDLVFFSHEGYPFKIIMNGILYNEESQTNVKITGLTGSTFDTKIIFDDTSLGTVTKVVQAKNGYEVTYVIKKKEITRSEKFLKTTAVNLERQLTTKTKEEAAKEKEEIEKENEKFVIRYFSEAQLASQTQTNPNNTNQPANVNTNVAVEGNTQSTTTSVTVNDQPVEQSNISMNVSIDANLSGDVTSTSTTTTQSTQTTEVYQMPGYTGAVGCPWPLNDGEFANVKQSIASKTFDDTKLTIAKQVINSNCLLSRQVKEIMLLFDFEDTRLELAKYAYGHTYDISNYYILNDAFDFESSIEELNEYISNF